MVKFSWSVGVNGVPFYGILIHMGADWSQVALVSSGMNYTLCIVFFSEGDGCVPVSFHLKQNR